MSIRAGILATAAALAASIPLMPEVASASATSMAGAQAIQNSAPAKVLDMGWRRGWGWDVGPGIVGGVIIDRALAAPYYYDPYYQRPYYPGPAYYPAYPAPYHRAPAYADPDYADAEAYCIQRFRSYDPSSGTYLGYDGYRHPCP